MKLYGTAEFKERWSFNRELRVRRGRTSNRSRSACISENGARLVQAPDERHIPHRRRISKTGDGC